MRPELQQALADKLLALADDELILAHRNSEWTGHAPILEEDIAFSNIAQDELGHAILWYTLLAELIGEDPKTYPDRLVFFREAPGYRNVQLVELPNEDWALSILRQYLFDVAERVWLEGLTHSSYRPLAEVAGKIRPEEVYHYRHSHAWVKRLGLGTEKSHRYMQNALIHLWPFAQQLFEPLPNETRLVEAGYVTDPQELRLAWERTVFPALEEAGLVRPWDTSPVRSRRDEHTEHLVSLLADMQQVARSEAPGTSW